jgi:predicted enzyme related to lactoylglutathione lyase
LEITVSHPFVFMDLRTHDRDRSRAFYADLFGWRATESLFMGAEGPWGGLTQLATDDERQPQWVPYAPVDDLDAALARAVDLGATSTRPRVDLPQGSVAVIEDPTGATLALWEPKHR